MDKETYLVTGGAGYIGSILVRKLLAAGHKVIVVDAGYFGLDSLDEVKSRIGWFSYIEEFVRLSDIKIDGVVHLSGLSNDPMADYDPDANHQQNYIATCILAGYCMDKGIKKFVYASSASVYGFNDEKVDENTSVNPQSAYAQTKVLSELFLNKSYIDNKNFIPISFRCATVMGSSPRPRLDLVVNSMVASVWKTRKINLHAGGETWRPLVNSYDVAECYMKFVTLPVEEFEQLWGVYNLVHKNYRVSELGLYMAHILQSKFKEKIQVIPEYKKQEARSYYMDGSKLYKTGVYFPKTGVMKSSHSVLNDIISGKIKIDDPINYNIKWLLNCERVCKILGKDFNMLKQV